MPTICKCSEGEKIIFFRIATTIFVKSKKDYKAKHNLMEFAPSNFEFPLLEETIRKYKENRLSVIERRLKLAKYLTIDD